MRLSKVWWAKWMIVSAVALCLVVPSLFAGTTHDGGGGGSGASSPNVTPSGNSENFEKVSSLKKFNTTNEMKKFLMDKRNLSGCYPLQERDQILMSWGGASSAASSFGVSQTTAGSYDGGSAHSTTNIQVAGVDEGDTVKNNDKYAYVISGNKTLIYIIDAYPPESAHIAGRMFMNGSAIALYLLEDTLIVISSTIHNNQNYYYNHYYTPNSGNTSVDFYSLENPEAPAIKKHFTLPGGYQTSRIIGRYFYSICQQYVTPNMDMSTLAAAPDKIQYIDEYDDSYILTIFSSIDMAELDAQPETMALLLGQSCCVYVSEKNIYLAHALSVSPVEQREKRLLEVQAKAMPHTYSGKIKRLLNSGGNRGENVRLAEMVEQSYLHNTSYIERKLYYQRVSDFEEKLGEETEYLQGTLVYRISINNGKMSYKTQGAVPGSVLNRYSMDEYKEHFRIATTSGSLFGTGASKSNNRVYVLNHDLKVVGSLTDIAVGETIYSARFAGDRAYVVTFKKIDPFFVIDLSNPTKPAVLGELKIPGYSTYLHPLNDDFVLGLGKDAFDMDNFAWYQGVKLSLFDVRNVTNPTEIAGYVMGDRGTESLALTDPHAFMVSKIKGIVALPVQVYLVNTSNYKTSIEPSTYGQYAWSGVYVFSLNETGTMELKGTVVHHYANRTEANHYYYNNGAFVTRTFYIGDALYSVSNTMMKVSALADLSELTTVALD